METIRFGSAIVRVYERGDGKWALKWREAGKGRGTTKTKYEDAVEAAKAQAKRLDGATGKQWVTGQDAEVLAKLKAIAGDRSPFAVLDACGDALRLAGGLAELTAAAEAYAKSKRSQWTLGELFRRLEDEYREHRRAQTWKSLKVELKPFADSLADLGLGAISPDLIAEWCSRGTPSPRTYNNRRAKWSTALGRARELGWIDPNQRTAAEIVPKRREERKSPSIWPVPDGERILSLLREQSPDLIRYFALQCWGGLRPSEAQAIRLDDLTSHPGYVHVRAAVAGKLGAERFVPMRPNLAAILGTLPSEADVLIPPSRDPSRKKRDEERLRVFAAPLNADTRLSGLVREAGILDRWPNDVCRHSFCSYRLAQTHSIGKVAEEAGNSEAIIRRNYRRPVPVEVGEAWFKIGL
ncbi:integrase [Haloferula luteola]|uniref:Integrase n=1 Tax=Haloferula luteola TaxID=595692 RepID=A0A840VEZ7_9BACT|nr:site-specific integrase [Haloferula luteola]MBB5351391.1 integrase [Haloferula luteola]